MAVKIYHNARCSKSRATLQLLQERGIEPEIIDYKKYPPTIEDLFKILMALDVPPTDLIRFKDAAAKALDIHPTDEKFVEEWIELMVENPAIIERPIVVNDSKAAIGRPPENVLTILD